MQKKLWLSCVCIVAFFLLVGFVFVAPRYVVDWEMQRYGSLPQLAAMEPDKYVLVVDEYRKTFAQVLGGFGFFGTLLLSLMTLKSNEKAKISDRFAKALDHLGAIRGEGDVAASEVRIGAVAELEGIGEESEREKRMIRSSFTAYLRANANVGRSRDKEHGPAVWRNKEIQAMLSLLGKWGFPASEAPELRMTDLDLRKMLLPSGANFENVIALRSCFDYSECSKVNFRNANLIAATFRGAILEGTDFRNALLKECNFVGDVGGEGWGYNRVERTYKWNTPSTDAKMTGADFRGTDLERVRITEAQYEVLIKDSKTVPPKQFVLPPVQL